MEIRSNVPAFPIVAMQYSEKVEKRTDAVSSQCKSPAYPMMVDASGINLEQVAVRCRKCDGCRLWRQRVWAARAHVEYQVSPRTWWITLTYRGSSETLYPEVQKFLKRLRKKNQVRYVLSEEQGETNGRLHYHVLLHCRPDLTRRAIEGFWPHGFVHSRLAKSAGLGRYLAKYLAKQSRIRASVGYGDFQRAVDLWDPQFAKQIENGIKSGMLPSGIELTPFGVKMTLPLPSAVPF